MIPRVSHTYWIFAVMASQVYLIMYVLMFIAAIRLRRSQPAGHLFCIASGYRGTSLNRRFASARRRRESRRSSLAITAKIQ